MNQRAHIRHAVNLTARLTINGQGHRQCRIEDFCLGGVLVRFVDQGEWDDRLQPLERDHRVSLVLLVDGNRGQREISLPARVARVLDGGAGLQFDEPNPTDLLSLQNHVRSQREQAAGPSSNGGTRVDTRPVLDAIRNVLHQALQVRLKSFFPRARAALHENEQAAAADSEQRRRWALAGDKLENAVPSVNRDFLRAVNEPLEQLFAGLGPGDIPGVSAGGGEGGLSTADKDMFEDWLTLRVMASRAEGRFHEQLLPLQLRFNELLNTALAARQNPLHPAPICSAFGRALKPLGLDRSAERQIMEIFEPEVLTRLGPLYVRVNEILIQAGVLPDLDVSRYLSNQGGQQDAAEAPAVQGPSGASRAGD